MLLLPRAIVMLFGTNSSLVSSFYSKIWSTFKQLHACNCKHLSLASVRFGACVPFAGNACTLRLKHTAPDWMSCARCNRVLCTTVEGEIQMDETPFHKRISVQRITMQNNWDNKCANAFKRCFYFLMHIFPVWMHCTPLQRTFVFMRHFCFTSPFSLCCVQ